MANYAKMSLSKFCVMVLLGSMMIVKSSENRMFTKTLSPRTVITKYGQMRGALVEFTDRSLKPVDAYLGLQYATTLTSQMRFMPPMSSAEKWRLMRVVFAHRHVCPQKPINKDNFEELKKSKPEGEIERLRRIASFVLNPKEECLDLNVFVPTGKNSDVIDILL